MEKFRYFVAFVMAKVSIVALKVTHHNGTDFPGVIATKICPNFLKYAKKPEHIISVSGTNGKTTCTNLLADFLIKDGKKVLTNCEGSNTISGITTSIIRGMTVFGKEKYDYAVFETDERSYKLVFKHIVPEYMLVINLSRDSIMRNGHPEFIGNFMSKYIPKETKLILNADELISANLAPENERAYFGIAEIEGDLKENRNRINDIRVCPKCQHKLIFDYVRYSNVGKARCSYCDFKSPEYDYTGFDIDKENLQISINDKDGEERYRVLNDSIYNIYNVVSVIATLREMGYSHKKIKEIFQNVEIVSSRLNLSVYGKRQVMGIMAKDRNAFGTARALEYIVSIPGTKEIVLDNSNFDDHKHWSENVCWLYDCDFELLNDDSVKHIVLCGPRKLDLKLRMLMAGIPEERLTLVDSSLDSVDKLKYYDEDKIFVLYGTALSQQQIKGDIREAGIKTRELIKQRLSEMEAK